MEGNIICFVIMPIGKSGTQDHIRNEKLYRLMIKPVLEECGFDSIRSDEINSLGNITKDIIEHLYHAELVIADLSDFNANVFYELGVRHCLKKYGTIPIIRDGQTLPFDIFNYRAIFYSTELDGPEIFKSDLRARLTKFSYCPKESDNPVYDAINNISFIEDLNTQREIKTKELAEIYDQLETRKALQLKPSVVFESNSLHKRERPAFVAGKSVEFDTGCGSLYVTLNEDHKGDLLELFAQIGKAGGCIAAWSHALGHLINLALQNGIEPAEILEQMIEISCPKPFGSGANKVLSCPDGIAKAMRWYTQKQQRGSPQS